MEFPRILKLLQQRLEVLVEFVECEYRTSHPYFLGQ